MKQLLTLFRENRFFRLAIIFGGLFLVLTLVLSPKRSTTPSSITPPSSTKNPTETYNRLELKDISDHQLKVAADYRSLISDRLPIKLDSFSTSAGINTSINIYYLASDPASTLRFEIYGLSYMNKDGTPLSNPNLVAFQESFKKGLSLLNEKGIDYHQVIFIYSDIEYIRTTVSEWVSKYSLLP